MTRQQWREMGVRFADCFVEAIRKELSNEPHRMQRIIAEAHRRLAALKVTVEAQEVVAREGRTP